jgi:uncharacterized protein (UPF0264 family)
MTRMLASVRTADEAEIVLSGGADIIDLKDPGAGCSALCRSRRSAGSIA